MPYLVSHTQLWYKELKAKSGFPDLNRTSQAKLLPTPTTGERILATRAEGDRIHWLIQKGIGEDIWFTWVPKDMVKNTPESLQP